MLNKFIVQFYSYPVKLNNIFIGIAQYNQTKSLVMNSICKMDIKIMIARLPYEIAVLISEFNCEHRSQLKAVFDDMYGTYFRRNYWMDRMRNVVSVIPYRILCRNCHERKMPRYIDMDACSSVCDHQIRDDPYRM